MKAWKSISTLLVLVVRGWLVAQSQTPEIGAPVVDRIGFPAGYQDTYKLIVCA